MNDRLQSIRNAAARLKARLPGIPRGAGAGAGVVRCLPWLAGLTAVAGAVALLAMHPPVHEVPRGTVSLRTNVLTGGVTEARSGSMLQSPGLHDGRDLPGMGDKRGVVTRAEEVGHILTAYGGHD